MIQFLLRSTKTRLLMKRLLLFVVSGLMAAACAENELGGRNLQDAFGAIKGPEENPSHSHL